MSSLSTHVSLRAQNIISLAARSGLFSRLRMQRAFSTTGIFPSINKASSLPKAGINSYTAPIKPYSSPIPSPSLRGRPALSPSFAASLAQKSSPTLLFRAQSQTPYVLTAYIVSGFCFSYAAFHGYEKFLAPPILLSNPAGTSAQYESRPSKAVLPDVPDWVRGAHAVAIVFMFGAGIYCATRTRRLITSISAVPMRELHIINSRSRANAKNMHLRIGTYKLFGGPDSKMMLVDPESVSLNAALSTPKDTGAMEREKRMGAVQRQWMEGRTSRLTILFRRISIGLSRLRSGEGFLRLNVSGKAFKLDGSGCWAMDDGKALEKLVKIK